MHYTALSQLHFLILLTLTSLSFSKPVPFCGSMCKTLSFFRDNTFKLIPEISDDFQQYPNPKKWTVRDPTKPKQGSSAWNGRQPSLFHKENVIARKEKGVTLTAHSYLNDTQSAKRIFGSSNPPTTWNPNPPTFWQAGYWGYTSAFLETKTAVKYGYFEARLRPMKTQLVNAFWLSSDTPDVWTEIDVLETAYVSAVENRYGVDHRFRVNPNAHSFRNKKTKQGLCKGCDGKIFSARPQAYTNKERLADEFHTYGLAWTKEAITFFFDGQPYAQLNNDKWHQELFIKFDVETNYAWQGILPDIATMGVPKFDVQWLRSYSIESKASRTTTRSAMSNKKAQTNDSSTFRQFTMLQVPSFKNKPSPNPFKLGKMKVKPITVPGLKIPVQFEDPNVLQRAPYEGESILKPVTPPGEKTWKDVMKALKRMRKRHRA